MNREELMVVRELSGILHKVLVRTSQGAVAGSTLESLRHSFSDLLFLENPGIKLSSFDLNIGRVVCHGRNKSIVVTEGDVVTIDAVICSSQGLYADGAWSFICGRGTRETRSLLETAWTVARRAVLSIKAGDTSLTMKKEIHRALADSHFSVLEDACGHGIGREMHLPPDINFSLLNLSDVEWREGMVFTIEPVICTGDTKLIYSKEKEWVSANGKPSAYFEHMVAVGPFGVECLNLAEINKLNSIDIFQQII